MTGLEALIAEGYVVECAGACLRVTAPPTWGPRQVRYVMVSTLEADEHPGARVREMFA